MKKYFGYRIATSNFFPNKLNLYLFSFLLFCTTNIYSQTLSAEEIYKKVSEAVVIINAYDSNNELSKQGSGVVINDKGYVVTNYHVLADNDRLEVLHNKEIVPYVDIIGIDVEKDILILKIKDKKFPSIKIGDSKSLNIGQRVYAIGSPLGFENTISEGIISGLRTYNVTGKNFIQITASISHGSSGGAIVNDRGELIGISTFTVKEGQNLNFAIPIDDVLDVKISSYSKNDAYKDFELFGKGLYEYEKGNFEESIKYFTIYIKKYPNDEEAYNNRGSAKANLENHIDAIKDYNKSIMINPNYSSAYYNRGGVKNKLGDNKGAIQDYTKAIEINPNYSNAYINRGNVKSELEDYEGAMRDFTKAIEINPNDAEAYNNRGLAKRDLEDFRGAIQDFNKSIEINPKYSVTYFNRGLAKRDLEEYRGAIQDYTKAIEINPNYDGAYNNRGNIKYRLEDYRGAIQDYTKEIEINPNDALAYYNIGVVKSELGDIEGAIQNYTKAIEINPDYSDAYRNRGIEKYQLEDYKGAINDYTKMIKINPNDADALDARGLAKYKLADYYGAIQDYTKMIEINPNDAKAYINRGVAKYQLDKNEACLDWSRAGELGASEAYDLIKQFCN